MWQNLAKVSEPSQGLERIGAVWGRDVAAEMLEVNTTRLDLRVRGFVSRPTLARAGREWVQANFQRDELARRMATFLEGVVQRA